MWSQALGTPVFLGQTTVSTAWYFAFITELAGVAVYSPKEKQLTILLCTSKVFLFFSLQDSIGRILCVPLKRANEIIGTTTEELVMRAQSPASWVPPPRWNIYLLLCPCKAHASELKSLFAAVHVYTSGLRCTAAPGHIVRHCFFPSFSFTGRVLQN
jgi:hypothetical protein